MANLTTGEAARLDKLRGKAKSLTIGTRIRNLEVAGTGSDNLVLGESGTSGSLTIFPSTAANSSLIISVTDIGAAGRNLTITNAAQAAARTYTIPDAGASASFVMTGTADQTILGDIILGSAATSDANLKMFSNTASKGSLLITCTDNNGDDVTTLTSSGTTTAAAITVTLPSMAGTLVVAESTQRQVYPFAIKLEDGDVLPNFAGEGDDGWTQSGNEELSIRWNNSGTPTDMAAVFHMPNDVDESSNVIVHIIGMPSSTNDTPEVDIQGYFSGVVGEALNADTDVFSGTGVSGEFTNVATWQEKTATIASADVPASPSTLTLIFHPKDSQLGTDDFLMASIWLEYTGKALTS